MLQAAGNQDALQIVNAIATGSFDITNSANHRQLSILHEQIPMHLVLISGEMSTG